MVSSVTPGNTSTTPPHPVQPQTWQNRSWEIAKEAASASLPLLTLYKPFSFPIAVGTGAVRAAVSTVQLAALLKEGNYEKVPAELVRTAVAVISLAGTFFAHPLGLLIATGYDLTLELKSLIVHLREKNTEEALKSCLKIIGHSLYFGVFLYGGIEVSICFFAVQVATGILEARHEFLRGHYIAGVGHALMALVRGGQLTGQIKALQTKCELQQILKSLSSEKPELNNHVGKLGEKWEFPSDHLPTGARVGTASIKTFNILNGHYMDWVTEKDTQGLNGSIVTQLHAIPSQKYPGITMRDELVMEHLLKMMSTPSPDQHLIMALQECSPEFLNAFGQVLPAHMEIVFSDPTLRSQDQNVVIYNKQAFDFQSHLSSIDKAFPTTSPGRTLMNLVFVEKATGEKFQIYNAHVPGDPQDPGTYDFARHLFKTMRPDCNTVALGDINFQEHEMQEALNREAGALGRTSPFTNYSLYNTNVGAYSLDGKSIDHIWVNSPLHCEAMLPDEVLPGLKSTVDLLHPDVNDPYWKLFEARKAEQLKQWHQRQQLQQIAV